MNSKSVRALLTLFLVSFSLLACDLLGGDHLKKAQDYVAQGKFNAAVIEYKNVLQDDPGNSDLRRTLAEIYLKVGNGASAEKEFRRATEGRPSDVSLQINIGRALLMQGEYSKAEQLLSRLDVGETSLQQEANTLHAIALAGLNKLDQASDLFEAVLAATPGNAEAALGLARIRASRGDLEGAKTLVAAVLAKDRGNIDGWLLEGNLALYEKDFEKALKAFQKAWGDGKDANTLRSFQSRFGIVSALLSLGRDDDALVHVDALLGQLPSHPMPHYWRARIAYKAGDQSMARDHLLQVVRVQPSHAPSNLLLGSIYYSQGDLAQAENYLQKYLVASPDDVQARKLLAATRLRLQTPGLAFDTLDPLLSEGDQDPQVLALAGSAALHNGDLDKGVEYLKKALLTDPDNAAMRTELGMAYLSLGDTQTAINELDRVIDSDDQQVRAQALLIMAHLRDKEFPQARAVIAKLKAAGQRPALAHSLSGLVSWAQGRLAEATKSFKDALIEEPDNLPALLDLARLEQQQGNLSEAAKRYDAVLAIDGNNLAALLGEAQIAAQRGDEEHIVKWLETARSGHPEALPPRLILASYYLGLKAYDKASSMVDEALKIVPGHAGALTLKGEVALASGSARDAVRIFQKLARQQANNDRHFFNLARAYVLTRQYIEARRALQQALKIRPDLLIARELLARLDIQEGKSGAAKKVISEIRSQSQGRELAEILEGDLAMKTGDLQTALKKYQGLATRQPDNRLAMTRVFMVSSRMKDEKAFQVLLDWIKGHPDDIQARVVAGSELLSGQHYAEAVAQYEAIIMAEPENSLALNNLAWLYGQLGDKRALSTARKAYESSRDDGAVIDTYAWMLVEDGQLGKGLPLLETAYDLATDNREIRYHLALAYLRQGEIRRAKKLLNKMQNDASDDKHAKSLAALLAE